MFIPIYLKKRKNPFKLPYAQPHPITTTVEEKEVKVAQPSITIYKIMSMTSTTLFNSNPAHSLLCSSTSNSSSSSSLSFIFKFKFPAKSQRSPLSTVEFRATTPRASTRIGIAENDSGQ